MVTDCRTFSFQNISFAARFACLLSGGVCEPAAQPPDCDQTQDIEQDNPSGDKIWDVNGTWNIPTPSLPSGAQNGTNFGGPFIENPFNLNVNRGNSNFDIRHQINVNYLYDLPFGKGKMLLSNPNAIGQAILGGWAATGIFRWASGTT